MINFIKISQSCFEKLNKPYKTEVEKDKIISFIFKEFKITIYYYSFGYEVSFDFFIGKNRFCLDNALIAAGCLQDEIPKFIFMSDSEIMQEHISKYVSLIDKYYLSLNDTSSLLPKLTMSS